MPGFISVHVGAGYHSEKKREHYSLLCKSACLKGVEAMKSGASSLDAVCIATSFLEDSGLTNAGRGSNLTWDGNVECDASIMESSGLYGAVGAVSGVQNPVSLAKEICLARSQRLSLDRVPPCFMVGDGALQWAKSHGVSTVNPGIMVTEKARKQFRKYKQRAQAENSCFKVSCESRLEERLDTVGAVCVDFDGRLSAAASSGGVLLKVPGRVGQAGQYGAGVWAQQCEYSDGNYQGCCGRSGIAVASSGTGEQLVATLLARTVAQPLLTSVYPAVDLHNILKTHFIDSPFLRNEKRKLGGIIVIKTDEEGERGELLWGHTTLTMGLGYMATNMKRPKSLISRLSSDKVGCEPIIGGVTW